MGFSLCAKHHGSHVVKSLAIDGNNDGKTGTFKWP